MFTKRFLALLCALLLFGLAVPRPAGALAVHVGADFRKMTAAACTLKAVEAMGVQQNFIYAQVDGIDAWGYDEKSFVLVHAVPIRDGVYIFVVAFSTEGQEAERLRNAIRKHVFDGPYNSRIPKVYHTSNQTRRQGPLAAHWGNFNKQATIGRFASFAKDAMERNRLQSSASGNQIIFGQNRAASVVALGVGLPRGTQVLVISASEDTKEAERLRNAVREYIVKVVSFD